MPHGVILYTCKWWGWGQEENKFYPKIGASPTSLSHPPITSPPAQTYPMSSTNITHKANLRRSMVACGRNTEVSISQNQHSAVPRRTARTPVLETLQYLSMAGRAQLSSLHATFDPSADVILRGASPLSLTKQSFRLGTEPGFWSFSSRNGIDPGQAIRSTPLSL